MLTVNGRVEKVNDIISGYTGMMLTVDCGLLTVHCQPSTVNRELEFTIPMLTDLIENFKGRVKRQIRTKPAPSF